jgi:hypothetical protein
MILIFLLYIINSIIKSQQTEINAKGLRNIAYQSTTDPAEIILSFEIPLADSISSPREIKLELTYPYKSNRELCEAECNLSADNNFYACSIKNTTCDLIGENKKIIINSIIDPPDYSFKNINSMTSVINFEADDLEMVCSNYKLSFFLIDRNINKHPYEKINFEFPIYYKDKQETAKCIIPKDGIYIPCTVDASNRIFEKGYFINFEYNKSIELTEDLNLTLKLKKYVLEDDCGKDINFWKILYFSKYNFISLMLLFSFYLF